MPLTRNRRRIQSDPRWSAPSPDDSEDEVLPDDDAEPMDGLDQEEPAKPAFVRIRHHQVGIYPKDSVVPVAAFENLERLLGMEAVEYDYSATEASIMDETTALVARLSQPVSLYQTIPRGPWVSSSVGDLIGPAVPRTAAQPLLMPSHVTLTVAEPLPEKGQAYAT